MKRLLALLGLTGLAVLTACLYLGEIVAFSLGIAAFVLFVVSMILPFSRREGTYPVAFLTAIVTVCIFMGYTTYFVNPMKEYDKVTAEVIGVQQENVYYQNGYYNYILKVKSIDDKKVNVKLNLCSKYALYTEPYDEIKFTSELSFLNSKSFAANKLFLRSYLYDEDVVEVYKPQKRPFIYYFKNLNKKFSTALYLEMGYDEASFSSAIMLGDDYTLDSQTKSLLRDTGVSHIAVVSGLHLSIVAAIFTKAFDKLFKSVYVSGIATIFAVISFALLCGFSVSVIRASVMLIIHITGKMIGRRGDSLNSLGLAALILITSNPYCVGDVGMLLSFASTLGIIFWGEKLTNAVMHKLELLKILKYRPVNKVVRAVVATVSVSLSAVIWTLPVIMLTYNGISTVSLLANLLIVPLMGFLLLFIALCIFTHYVTFMAVLCDVLCGIVSALYKYIIYVCNALVSLPHSYVYTDKPYFYVWLSVSLILVSATVLIGRKSVSIIAVLLSVLILFIGAANYSIARNNYLTLHIPDTGKGMSVVLEGSDGFAVLRASGSKRRTYVVSDMLDSLYSKSECMYIDIPGNNSGVFRDNLVNEFDYNTVLRYANKSGAEDASPSENTTYFQGIHTVSLWSKAEIELIEVSDCVFEYLTVGDTSVLIVPKDADCAHLLSEYTYADIIVTDGIAYNYDVLSCDTMYIIGQGYMADAAREVMRSVYNNVVCGTDLSIDIDIC